MSQITLAPRTRKNLFVVHSPITCMMMRLIIKHQDLAAQDTYICCTSRVYPIVRDLLPSNHYFILDAKYDDSEVAAVYQYGLANYKDARRMIDGVGLMMNPEYHSPFPNLDTPIDNAPQKFSDDFDYLGVDYHLYVPHLVGDHFNILASLANCKQVHFFEEGSMNYLDMTFVYGEDNVQKYQELIAKSNFYEYERCGLKKYYFEGQYNVTGITNTKLEREATRFYRLSNMAFSKIDANPAPQFVELDYSSLIEPNYISKLIRMQQQAYEYLQVQQHPELRQLLANPNYIGNYVNIIALDRLDNYVLDKNIRPLFQTLIRKVKEKGAFYVQIKFHPLNTQRERQMVKEILEEEKLAYDFIPNELTLELEFASSKPHTFVVHSIGSSLILYASIMKQLSYSYQELMAGEWYNYTLRVKHNYDLKGFKQYLLNQHYTLIDEHLLST